MKRANWPTTWKPWRLDRIVPYPKNPRTHPPEQIKLLASMLTRWGPDQPIVVDEAGVILKGHGRLEAARAAGFAEFPVVVRKGLPDADKTAMRLADNQVALLSGWDRALITEQITDLKTAGFDIPLLGFREATLRGWGIAPAGAQRDPEAIPGAPTRPTVQPGDVWTLGGHRIACGDATKAETWKALCKTARAAMVFTDPPYGVSYQGERFDAIKGDDKRRDDLYRMLLTSMREMGKHAIDTAAFYIWHASSTREDFAQAMKAAGLVERQYLLWVKPAAVFGHADYQWQHEPCFYAAKAGHSPAFHGERAESTVWHVQLSHARDTAATVGNGILLLNGEGGALYVQSRAPKHKKIRQIRLTKDSNVVLAGSDRQDGTVWEVARDGKHEHPTQKPVELARRAIENSSRAGEIVLDGFLGSGTTLIGAEMTGRRCYGIELDPTYAEVAIRRWERFAGQHATMDGQTLTQRGTRASQKRRGRATAPPLPPNAASEAQVKS